MCGVTLADQQAFVNPQASRLGLGNDEVQEPS